MGQAIVKEAIAAPAEKVWAVIAEFGNTSWMPGGNAEVVGSGPGMSRIISAGDQKIHEVLESADDATQTLVYTIPIGVPFPVTDYRATIRVTGDASTSELEWGCTFEPDGVDEAQVTTMIEGLYSTMVGWVRDSIVS